MATQALDCSTQVISEAFEADSHAEDSKNAEMGPIASETDPGSGKEMIVDSLRAEIDTSAPFESVKEAANRFGGMGFWRPLPHKPSQHEFEAVDITRVEEQAVQLEKDVMAKERETLDVLKELETTKMIVEELKLKLKKEASEVSATLNANLDDENVNPSLEVAKEKENHENLAGGIYNSNGAFELSPSSVPGFILMELKQAKLNLTRITSDLSGIRATVQSFNKKIEIERLVLENTFRKLSLKSSKISSLEEEVNKTRVRLQVAQDSDIKDDLDNPIDVSTKLRQLSSEVEQYRKMGETVKSEVLRAISAIEHTKTRIKTSETRLVAAKKMKEAARATEAVALAEIKAISSNEQKPEGVTLSCEQYTSLISKAREAEEASKRKVIDTMLLVDEAKVSKMEILKTVEEATEEVKTSKKVLEEALDRVEAANRAKLAVEEALRKWKSENGQRRRSGQNSKRFKNSSCPSHHRKDDGLNLLNDDCKPVLRPTLSIGQILSGKLFLTEEFGNGLKLEKGGVFKRKMSLGQIFSRPNGETPFAQKAESKTRHKQLPVKRKKFGFPRFSDVKREKIKQKKKLTPSFMCHCE